MRAQPTEGYMQDQSTVLSKRLRTPDAADYCGLSPRTLEKLRVLGGGPTFMRLGAGGRAVVYDTRYLDGWLAAHRRRSTSHTGEAA